MPQDNSLFPADNYDVFLKDLKTRIRQAQVRASLAVNQEPIILYWQIGREILARQQQEGWGTKVIDRLAKDHRATSNTYGLSRKRIQIRQLCSGALHKYPGGIIRC